VLSSDPLNLLSGLGESMRYLVIFLLLCAVGSLASGLFFLIKDKGNSDRTVKALTVRVAISITIFLLLMAGYYFGIIPKEGLR
jgi:hypothetical protein